MMLGTVIGASIPGQVVSRLGSYRWPGLVGVVLMSIGMFLLSTISEATTYPIAISFMVLLGAGLGFTFPSFTIASQNAVEHRYLGIATSTVQFYRTSDGALGLVLLGSLMTNRFRNNLIDTLPPEVRQSIGPNHLSGIAENPATMVSSDAIGGLMSSLNLSEAAAAMMLDGLSSALASSISSVFLATFFILIAAIAIVLFLRDAPLRSTLGRQMPSLGRQMSDELPDASLQLRIPHPRKPLDLAIKRLDKPHIYN